VDVSDRFGVPGPGSAGASLDLAAGRSDFLIGVARQVVDTLDPPDLRGAFLFGSAVWGDADEASDLDIMLVQERPVGYRKVVRARVADVLGRAAPLPHGPRFVDLAHVSAVGLEETLAKGTWSDRLKRAAILRDTDGYVQGLRTRVRATHFTSEALARRFGYWRERAEAAHAAVQGAAAAGGAPLAMLHSRLAVQAAASGLLDLNDDRVSVTHFVDSVERALRRFGRSDLFAPCLRALCLRDLPEDVDRTIGAFHAFAGVLREWLEDADLRGKLSEEDLAWTIFTCGEETREEIEHKVEVLRPRLRTLQFYLDGIIHVHVGIQFGRVLNLRVRGDASRIPSPAVHALLRDHSPLFPEWVAALRLSIVSLPLSDADALVTDLLATGQTALARL
jgi:predicted nucleotidyltransferase